MSQASPNDPRLATVRSLVAERLTESAGLSGPLVRLPTQFKSDVSARTGLLVRLASSRMFTRGGRSGALRSAQRRSGQAFRMDVKQKVIVKALVSRHYGRGSERGAALQAHLVYISRTSAGRGGQPPVLFDRDSDGPDAARVVHTWSSDRHHFRFIISPEHGDRIADLQGYVRDVLGRVAADLGEPDLSWVGACHYDTDQPHAHVLIRGRRADGRDLVIARDYVAYGFRARTQEVAQERLGDLSRLDAEKRIWRETQADRFTGFDRRLLAAADDRFWVEAGWERRDAWSALTRGRLLHLEALGLASRSGQGFILPADLRNRLTALQVGKDLQRTLAEHRMHAGARAGLAPPGLLTGEIVRRGSHDELGSSPFVIVRDRSGVDHYCRLRSGSEAPAVGRAANITVHDVGVGTLSIDRRRGLSL